MSKKFLPLYISAKIIKIDRDFPKLWSQMYCHLFYGSQGMCMFECQSVLTNALELTRCYDIHSSHSGAVMGQLSPK